MQFRVTDGRCEALLRNGDVVKFESLAEMQEVCHQRLEIMRLLRGNSTTRTSRRFVACKATSECAKKKVRINIHPDTEKIKDFTQ